MESFGRMIAGRRKELKMSQKDVATRIKKEDGLAGNVFSKDIELPPGSGNIIKGSDLKAVAQHVGKTSRVTCGTCHR